MSSTVVPPAIREKAIAEQSGDTPPKGRVMDWFERLTGFREENYHDTRAKLALEDGRLRSLVNGASHSVGEFELVSLAELRRSATSATGSPGRLRARVVTGDVRKMHQKRENAGALFQVASQFNMLEMTGPSVTPEQGVTRYQSDRTQGPACAIAAGAATIYRNYFVPVRGGVGQTAERQLDGLAAVGEALSRDLGLPVGALWTMQNGYALCSRGRPRRHHRLSRQTRPRAERYSARKALRRRAPRC
jgi:hypothetical protein